MVMLAMQLGAEAVFVGSGIFKSSDPVRFGRAIVEATTHYTDPTIVAKVSRGLGDAMKGAELATLETRLAERGWEVEILATDINSDSIARAKEGLYAQFEIKRGLPLRRAAAGARSIVLGCIGQDGQLSFQLHTDIIYS